MEMGHNIVVVVGKQHNETYYSNSDIKTEFNYLKQKI